jgi:hypothetical protein
MNVKLTPGPFQVLAAQRGYGRPGPGSPEMSIAGNSWSRCLSFRKAIWAVGLLLACCASSRAQIPGTDDVNQTKLYFKNNLAAFDRLAPHSNACGFGAVAQEDGYIFNVASWAEQAGLRRGDRIKSIAGSPASTIQDIARALGSVPPGGPLIVEVSRGSQAVTISLPCRDSSETWATFRKAFAAGADGRWDDCITGLQRAEYLIGFSPPASQLLFARLRCMSAKNGSSGKRDGIVEAQLLYEVNLLRLSENRYSPEGLDEVRGVVLASISWLRTNGFASLASDLELQLQNASRASK